MIIIVIIIIIIIVIITIIIITIITTVWQTGGGRDQTVTVRVQCGETDLSQINCGRKPPRNYHKVDSVSQHSLR